MSKFLHYLMLCLAVLAMPLAVQADDAEYQLPDPHFEDWSGTAFDGNAQPKYWHASNVEQSALGMSFKFNFAHKETGRTGFCIMAQDQTVGAAGITETSPSYYSLGYGWQYLEGLNTGSATAGTKGGYAFTHRPDSISIWIKRTGNNTDKEDYHILFYSWSGTAKGSSYKNKNGGCTSTTIEDEESDVRIALNGNECKTVTAGGQVAEGWIHERAKYTNWTNIRIPIYYMNDNAPKKCNLILSASNYPNYRSNSGLYEGNSLYVDDVELIYSSKVQILKVGNKEWKGFDPNSTAVQEYALPLGTTTIPTIEAYRGAGSLTNVPNQSTTRTVNFPGRKLSGGEIQITYGNLTNTPTVIKVTSEDGKSTTTYKIQFKAAKSNNAKLADITYAYIDKDDKRVKVSVPNFSPTTMNYTNVEVPYGAKRIDTVSYVCQEDSQKVTVSFQPTIPSTATLNVTAEDGTTKATYKVNFVAGKLSDNTLADIKVNGKSIPGFTPTQTVYKVSLPVGTTNVSVQGISAYPAGQQTISYNPSNTLSGTIDGTSVQISVTTPGNTVAKVYKLNFKLEASSYTYLSDLQVTGSQIQRVNPSQATDGTKIAFTPENLTYYVNLKMGTTSLPAITWTKGDEYQTVEKTDLPAGVVDGTVRITVTAGNGDQSLYKIVFTTEKSDRSTLAGILIGGMPLTDFDPDHTSYTCQLPVGTPELPVIEPILGDEYQTYSITSAGVNGKTRITVTAGDGSTTVYQITFSVQTYSVNTLASLSVAGYSLQNAAGENVPFDAETEEYWVNLPQGTSELPAVSYTLMNENLQSALPRPLSPGVLNGDYKITVRPQSGASRTYIIHFSVATSGNNKLAMIYIDRVALAGFSADQASYEYQLPEGVSAIPMVTFEKGEATQRVVSVLDGKVQTITVTAESGAKRVYTVTFIVVASANAYLNMIQLDGVNLPGFNSQTLNYTVKLVGDTCPNITVDKAPGQQVTITAPYGAGTAYIAVKPEEGATNLYTIEFEPVPVASAQLDGIAINGVAVSPFKSDSMNYTATYSKEQPTITYTKRHASQTVKVLWKDAVAWIHVEDTLGNKAAYSITFTREKMTVKSLDAIYADGALITGFNPAVFDYAYDLQPGSNYPELSYKVAEDAKVVSFGQMTEGKWGIKVAAEDGTTVLYTVTYTILKHSDATLKDLKVAGYDFTYNKTQNTYGPFTIAEGVELPAVTATPEAGQSVLTFNENDSTQKVLVMAENGVQNVYTIAYTRVLSSHVELENIVIAGYPDFAFNPTVHNYIITLSGDAKTVPSVNAVPKLENQTVTTYFCRPDGVMQIHVQAQDGATGDYYIAFPVEKSSDTKLQSLMINNVQHSVDTTEYIFDVPFTQNEPYDVVYKAKAGQLVHLIETPLTGTTKIIVTNEKGDNSRTYSISYNVAQPEGANVVAKVKYSYVTASDATVNKEIVPTAGNNNVTVPFGAKSFTVTEVVKNFEQQTIQLYNGGIRRGATIIAVSNRAGEDDVTYTITPVMEADTVGKLKDLQFKGVTVPRFRPDVYNYIVDVTAQPTANDFVGTAYSNVNVTKSTLDTKLKQITLTVEGGATYSVCWFYTADEWPFNHVRVQSEQAYWYEVNTLGGIFGSKATKKSLVDPTGYKPQGWKVPADLLAYIDYNATVSHFTYYTGHEVTVVGAKELTLSTVRGGALNSSMPGTLTLGGLSLPDGVALNGNTKVSYEKNLNNAVVYRNTPEQFAFEYQPIMNTRINAWNAWVAIGTSSGSVLAQQDIAGNYDNKGQWQTKTTNLSYNGTVGKLNIMLCASEASGNNYSIYAGSDSYASDLQIRNMRMIYSSALTGATVNGKATTKNGNTFTYQLADDEVIIGMPSLAFTKDKPDQTQTIEWLNNGEWLNGELTAKVVNYGENANTADRDSTIYTVVLKRTPVTVLNHTASFGTYETTVKGDTTFINLPLGTKQLPDLNITPASPHQLVAMTKKGNAVTVKVTAEDNSSKTTVYVFREVKGTESTPMTWSLESGVLNTVDAENHIYSVEAAKMPEVEITKQEGQMIDINYTLNGAVFTVTSADGKSQTTYTINRLNPVVTTTGQIETFSKNGTPWAALGGDTYSTTENRPAELITFERKNDPDSVVYIQAPEKMEWQVFGTANHTYTLTYPTAASSNANLANILIDGVPYSDFSTTDTEYTIEQDSLFFMDAVGAEMTQRIVTTQATAEGEVVVYTTTVTAEDGATTKTYHVTVRRPKSTDATLTGILVDSVLISGFNPTTLNYTVTLPLPADGVKREQPRVPAITYIAGQQGQIVTVTDGVLNESATELYVKSEAGNDNTYTVMVNAEPSHCVDLTGITVNGEIVDQFEPGRHYYSRSIKTSNITVDYMADDRFQTVVTKIDTVRADHQLKYTLTVTAEDGLNIAKYEVMIYIENQSNDAQLANILLNGQELENFERALNPDVVFDGGNNNYEINLPAGTTVLPEVSAKLKMDGQTVDIIQKADSILLNVYAVDGTPNTYTLKFSVPLSKNADLSMIFLDGDSLPNFDPTYYFYQIELAEGVHTMPEVTAQKGEASQTLKPVEIDMDKLQATVKVQAEDPATRENTYIVVFHINRSNADSLTMIYQDGQPLEGFAPKKTYYALSLPVGTTAFPDLSWQEENDLQTVKMEIVEQTANTLIRQIIVTAESGKKMTYTVSYTIDKSDIAELQMLFVDQKQLDNFDPYTTDYYVTLTAAYAAELNGQMPLVEYITSDDYQTVLISQMPEDSLTIKSLGYKSIVTVSAASGRTTMYTIHYPVELSTVSTLNMINVGGKPLANYDSERMNYKVEIEKEASVPVVSVIKKEEMQVYEIQVVEDTVWIYVAAEDVTYTSTYKLTFERLKSRNAKLDDIILSNAEGQQFEAREFPYRSDVYSYIVNLPYDQNKTAQEQLPTITAVKADDEQTTEIQDYALPDGDIQVDVVVTAPNGEDQTIYSITFHFVKPSDALLSALSIHGEEFADFRPTKYEYTYSHPYGTDPKDYFTQEDVAYTLSDSLAVDTIYTSEDGVINIVVTAQDGRTKQTYLISQITALDGDNYLAWITIDGDTIIGFDPEETFYTYYIFESDMPTVDAAARSENADIDMGRFVAGDTMVIICTAADQTERYYYVHFAITKINPGITATNNDVVLSRVPGAYQFMAATVRQGVSIVLYDQYGHLVYTGKVPVANPNDAEMLVNAENQEFLNKVTDTRSGLIINILPGQPYFYAFYADEKKILSSGKIMAY